MKNSFLEFIENILLIFGFWVLALMVIIFETIALIFSLLLKVGRKIKTLTTRINTVSNFDKNKK